MVTIFAIITAKPGLRDKVLAIFNANVPKVHAEDGCLEYRATVDAQGAPPMQTRLGPDSFAVVERWASMRALEIHAAAPHIVAYRANTQEMVASRVVYVLSNS